MVAVMEASSPPPTPASGGQSGTNVMLRVSRLGLKGRQSIAGGKAPLLKYTKTISPERVKEVAAQSFSNTMGIQYSVSGEINKILSSFTPSGLVLFVFLRPGASPLAMYRFRNFNVVGGVENLQPLQVVSKEKSPKA